MEHLFTGPAGQHKGAIHDEIYSSLTAGLTLATLFSPVVFAQHYTQINLDANIPGAAEATDPQLVNGWGIARGPGSTWWVSDEATGFATLYNGPGAKQSLVVTIPKSNPNDPDFPHWHPYGNDLQRQCD